MNTKKCATILALAAVLAMLGIFQARPAPALAEGEPLPPLGIVSAGDNHNCALRPDGSVDCWGSNVTGQAVDQPGPYSQVSSGGSHTCALRPDGSVDCWGSNSSGQATDQLGPYTQVSAGIAFTCVLTPSGAADCWGFNTSGQAEDQSGPFTQISSGAGHACALTPSGAVDCWGNDNAGQAEDQPGPYTQVSAGDNHTCALRPDGSVDCWGSNNYGQAVDQPGPYIRVSSGSRHTCAVTSSGAVDCWGDNYFGQAEDQPGPYTQVDLGYNHTCALRLDGSVDCWGSSNYGQAADQPGLYGPYIPDTFIETTPSNPSNASASFSFHSDASGMSFECQLNGGGWSTCASPKSYTMKDAGEHTFQVRAINTIGNPDPTPATFTWIVSTVEPVPLGIVSAGDNHNCALRPDGSVDCWGFNVDGQAVDQPGPYTQVSSGGSFTCALTPSGALDCWGNNNHGQAEDQPGPFIQVSAGVSFTCALRPDGSVDCWGWNYYGQAEDQPGPYTQVSAGDNHTCALRPDGSVDCWGSNNYGQAVDQPGPYIRVSSGSRHTCAVTPSGAVDCWGDNYFGQAEDQPGPYTQVDLGYNHTCALRPDGSVDCWGSSNYGQAADQPGPYGPYAPVVPVLTSLSPASATASSVDLTLTVTGSDFNRSTVVRWNGADLATTYVSACDLTALIPADSLASVQTAQITVITPLAGSSDVLAFFVTQAAANVTSQEVTSGTDPSAAAGSSTASASGDGLLAVAQYDTNPGGTPSFTANGTYFDVFAAPENTFSQVTITACGMSANDKLFWWDLGQGKWLKASPQTYADGCVTLNVNANSSPSLTELQGTFFAAGVSPNTPPVANPAGPYLAAVNTALSFDGSLSSDEDGNPLTFAWDFGDGTTSSEAQPSHNYAAAGIYNACLTVHDGTEDSTPVCTIAVVYDPSAGYVTGGGWIDSPAGAYSVDPTLTGKATFGFVSKYLKGATVPTGNTEFQFQAGSFNFHSAVYEWLVVDQSGTNAQFKGTGTINGQVDPNGDLYKFMIWATDGASSGRADTFRIKIWYEVDDVENILYDNGTNQPVGGGNIIVHVSK